MLRLREVLHGNEESVESMRMYLQKVAFGGKIGKHFLISHDLSASCRIDSGYGSALDEV